MEEKVIARAKGSLEQIAEFACKYLRDLELKNNIEEIDELLGAVPIEEDEKNGGLKDSYKAK